MPDLDLALLPGLIEDGYLRTQRHPTLPLTIYNYTAKTQAEGHWTPEARACRGLVLADDGEIVVRPLERFPNWDEPGVVLPFEEDAEVFEKLDGSLILVRHHYRYGLVVASRGSFTSPHAERARQLLGDDVLWIEPGVTYCFELIVPEFRIVLDYGPREELVLLAARWTASGNEIPLRDLDWMPFSQPRRYPPAAIEELAAHEEPNSEGYVLRFASGVRAKCKLAEYKRLHKIVTGTSERTIWEMLASGAPIDAIFERVPDEFFAWARGVMTRLTSAYEFEVMRASLVADVARGLPTRREQAEYILAHAPNPPAAFNLLDGKSPKKVIWKALKPESARPFWNREDEES